MRSGNGDIFVYTYRLRPGRQKYNFRDELIKNEIYQKIKTPEGFVPSGSFIGAILM